MHGARAHGECGPASRPHASINLTQNMALPTRSAPVGGHSDHERSAAGKGEHGGVHRQEAGDVSGADEPGHEARGDPEAGREGQDERGGPAKERAGEHPLRFSRGDG